MMEERPIKIAARESLVSNVVRTIESMNGRDAKYFKVFSVGFNKSGTTSMYSLFRSLGFEAMDGPHWRPSSKWHLHYQFQTFTDGPPEDFKYLDRTFPNSKFILNVRKLNEWLDSRIEHVRYRMQSETYKAKMSGGKLPDKDMVKEWALRRERHHKDVLQYFTDRPSDLLIVNYIDDLESAAKIAKFVGKELVSSEKPYTRSTPETRRKGTLRNEALIKAALTELGLDDTQHSAEVLFETGK